MNEFTIFPALVLRRGMAAGTVSVDPLAAARGLILSGTRWLHLTNLDAALGEPDEANQTVIRNILEEARCAGVRIQLSGGLCTPLDVVRAFRAGVSRVMPGTLALQNPDALSGLIAEYGAERIGASLSGVDGYVVLRGKQTGRGILAAARSLRDLGLRWVQIYERTTTADWNLSLCRQIAASAWLNVLPSASTPTLTAIRAAREAGMAGMVVDSNLIALANLPLAG